MATDQITKAIFGTRDFLVKNYGLPFGVSFGPKIDLLIVAACFILFSLYFYFAHKNKRLILGFAMILAAAFSNIIDRLSLGYVRDFIDLNLGFTFNLADVFIIIGIIILLRKHPLEQEG